MGHGGEDIGYVSLAGCMPTSGVVAVVLSSEMIDTSPVAGSLASAVLAG